MSLLRAVIRGYLRIVGWYVDHHDLRWPNETGSEDD